MWLLPLIFSIGIVVVHIIGERLSEHIERFHVHLLNFGAGLMVGTFFLEILPQVTIGETYLGYSIYVAFLVGFGLIYVLESLVLRHATSEKEVVKDITIFEATGVIAYVIIVGLIISVFSEAYSGLSYFIILIPFYVRAFAISIFMEHINDKLSSRLNRALQLIGPIIGTLIGLILIGNKTQLFLVFSFTMGVILYVIARDVIPLGKKGKPVYFILGVLFVVMFTLSFRIVHF